MGLNYDQEVRIYNECKTPTPPPTILKPAGSSQLYSLVLFTISICGNISQKVPHNPTVVYEISIAMDEPTKMATVPMPEPTVPRRPLKSYKLLSFDIYGTLIDWETSITRQFLQLISRLPASHHLRICSPDEQKHEICALFKEVEGALQSEQPTMRYDRLLAEVYLRIAKHWGVAKDMDDQSLESEAENFGGSVGEWQAFPDTVDAMKQLKKHYCLVVLSNVNEASFSKTLFGPLEGISFNAVYVAENIGSYKPSLNNFRYLIEHVKEEFGVEKEEILHTAQSLFHDHIPAKQMGMSSAWIAREGAAMDGEGETIVKSGSVGFGWRFASLGEMADAVEDE